MKRGAGDISAVRPRAETSLRDLGLLFVWLGTTAFGGPAAHIAIMDDAVVRRRHWLARALPRSARGDEPHSWSELD